MSKINKILQNNNTLKLFFNQMYVYLINLLHMLLNLFPGFIRNAVFKLLFGKAGKNVYVDYKVYFKFPWLVEFGSNVSINRGVEFYSDYFNKNKIIVGSNVRIAPNVRFHAAGHDYTSLTYKHTGGNIVVGDDVWIGASVIFLPGVTIGDRCVIGAGSVVSKDIPADSIAVGVPARVVKKRIED